MTHPDIGDELAPPTRRLWTPWRMQYVGGSTTEDGCLFCNRLRRDDDVASLILHRAQHSFAIMNLFPYNTGHIMLVPNEHVPSPEHASSDALREIADLLPPVLRALRRVLACHGFNVGLNIGAVAGAGVADHMHEHVVPRWNGDANFMPILGGATVMPELIPVTYAKLRAEIAREIQPEVPQSVRLVVLDESRSRLLLDEDSSIPVIQPVPDEPIWRTAINAAATRGITAQIAGWADADRADSASEPAFTLFSSSAQVTKSIQGRMVDQSDADATLSPIDRQLLRRALDRLS